MTYKENGIHADVNLILSGHPTRIGQDPEITSSG